jgi:hypothetical protein
MFALNDLHVEGSQEWYAATRVDLPESTVRVKDFARALPSGFNRKVKLTMSLKRPKIVNHRSDSYNFSK